MKKILIVVLLIIAAVIALGVIKDQIIKGTITIVATQVTGAPVHIDSFALGILGQSVRISGFKMYNPKGFPRGILVELAKINVSYDLASLLKKKIHLLNAEIELKEMSLIKDKEGNLNVDELKVVKEGKKRTGKPAEQMPMQIDKIKLDMGKIIYRDYSVQGEPSVKVYDININKSYKNITSVQQLAALILAEPMKSAGIEGAKVYGVAMLAGVAVLPAALAVTFAGKDSVEQVFAEPLGKVYETSLDVLRRAGKVTREDWAAGILNAEVKSAKISVRISKEAGNKTKVFISARKYLFPKPEIAGGILYEISEKLK